MRSTPRYRTAPLSAALAIGLWAALVQSGCAITNDPPPSTTSAVAPTTSSPTTSAAPSTKLENTTTTATPNTCPSFDLGAYWDDTGTPAFAAAQTVWLPLGDRQEIPAWITDQRGPFGAELGCEPSVAERAGRTLLKFKLLTGTGHNYLFATSVGSDSVTVAFGKIGAIVEDLFDSGLHELSVQLHVGDGLAQLAYLDGGTCSLILDIGDQPALELDSGVSTLVMLLAVQHQAVPVLISAQPQSLRITFATAVRQVAELSVDLDTRAASTTMAGGIESIQLEPAMTACPEAISDPFLTLASQK